MNLILQSQLKLESREEKRKLIKNARGLFSNNRDPLVENLACDFMLNRIHLLLRQVKNEGINQFVIKFG
jgi:hypothetical protein